MSALDILTFGLSANVWAITVLILWGVLSIRGVFAKVKKQVNWRDPWTYVALALELSMLAMATAVLA